MSQLGAREKGAAVRTFAGKHQAFFAFFPAVTLLAASDMSLARGRHTATIVIAEENSLLYQRGDNDPIVWESGDSVLVEWENSSCCLSSETFNVRSFAASFP